ncbi:VOC family protein [Sphingobium sp.]|uniref:VOC family protein n=1 Tax=Sphingobium sp. TaxID=1912891 RepID=UPI002BC38F9D|nr:VOC family protein [Sphingobium sp.]HUD91766.1 VOC family protein [Sphingobium sp.]
MIDLSRTHHKGIAVADIDRAVADYGAALGLTFAPVRDFDPLPFWTPEEGAREIKVRATYSLGGPIHVELVQGDSPFYDPASPEGARHVGVWVDDLPAEAERLAGLGWTIRAANAAPQDGYGMIAYFASPDKALLVELISAALKPAIDEWLGEG